MEPVFRGMPLGSCRHRSPSRPVFWGDPQGVRMFRNAMPRYEILSEEAMATLDGGWRRIVSEIGVEFVSERALELFRQAGQKVEDQCVIFDPDFVLEQVAKAPRSFDVQARNPAHTVHIGDDAMVFGSVYGPARSE